MLSKSDQRLTQTGISHKSYQKIMTKRRRQTRRLTNNSLIYRNLIEVCSIGVLIVYFSEYCLVS